MDDIFQTLSAEHATMLGLIARLVDGGRDEALLGELRRRFDEHRRAEEDVLYPLLESDPEIGDLVREAYVQHHLISVLLRETDLAPTGEPEFRARMTVLGDLVQMHIDKEEGPVFLRGRQAIGARRQVEMNDALARQRERAA
jgi:hypothetical protein